ncbi:hypothetical protein [Kineococcus terrestris]|uniref:hypothetical protein n=1 Tax=Kineococcus terrestris TaxID=2044856 RepID=UPI0034DB3C49
MDQWLEALTDSGRSFVRTPVPGPGPLAGVVVDGVVSRDAADRVLHAYRASTSTSRAGLT